MRINIAVPSLLSGTVPTGDHRRLVRVPGHPGSASFVRCVALALIGVLAVACAGSTRPRESTDRRGGKAFARAANARARAIADRIVAAGVDCENYSDSLLAPLRASYVKQRLPLPHGSGQCDGGPAKENVLIEVFSTDAPNATAFIARKAALLCTKGFELGRKPDGTNDFPGLPYVIAIDGSWVVEPDSKTFNEEIARALRRPAMDACDEVSPRPN